MTNDCSKRTLEIIDNSWSNISANNRSGNDQCLLRPNDSRKVSQKSGRNFFSDDFSSLSAFFMPELRNSFDQKKCRITSSNNLDLLKEILLGQYSK